MEKRDSRIPAEISPMFLNYCRIVFRNLRRSGLYAFINVLGLGIGIAAIIWGIQNYRFYTAFDRFHRNEKQLFRVLITVAGGEGLKGPCPAPVATAAVGDFPGIQAAVRWENKPLNILAAGNQPFSETANFTDPAFFDLFTFPLLRGTARLSDPSTILITETAAKKFFGAADPLGRRHRQRLQRASPRRHILTFQM